MTEKSTPGADVIYYIYDNADRVVASQDGCQRAGGNRWLLIRYNPFGEEARRYLSAPFTREALTSAFASEACPESVYSNVGNRLLLERQTGGIRPQGAPAFTSVSGVVTADSLSTSDASRVVWERVYEADSINNGCVERSFFYDRRGRLRQTVERDAFGGLLTTSVLPDYQGNIKRTVTTYTLGGSVFNVDASNEYDRRGRLLSSVTSSQGTGVKTDYSYDDLGRLNGATYASLDGQDVLCTRDSVNIQGFVTESSAALAGGTNVYSQQLRYFSPERGTLPLYSGSISEWKQTQGAESDTYGFSYDNAGRLLSGTRYHGQSTAAQASFTERGLSYDRAGGILSLQRFGSSDSAPDANLTMTYDGMRLASVSGTVEGQSIDAAMTYDPCGRTTHDGIRGLDYGYDRLGFLTSVSGLSSNTPDTLMLYKYLSDGTRMLMTGSEGGSLLYRGPFTLRLTGIGSGSPSVSFLRAETSDNHAAIIADGTQSTGNVYLYVTDHLSSVRAIVDMDGNVMERNDYYTFGKRHTTGRTYASLAASPFLFSGKEDQSLVKRIADQDATASAKLNFLNFGARHYDPVVPRWLTQDPLSEKYYNLNPYSYCAADPVTLIDPDGEVITDYFDVSGKYLISDGIDNGQIRITSNEVVQTAQELCLEQDKFVSYLMDNSISLKGAYSLGNIDDASALNVINYYNKTGLPLYIDNMAPGYFNFNIMEDKSAKISVNVAKGLKPIGYTIDNYYDIHNALNVHEGLGHYQRYKELGLIRYSEIPKSRREMTAIELQFIDPSWPKTTKKFKDGVTNYYKIQQKKQ